jgi:ubiquinone/menaquinone biosynthesis C-methylase UbiE
VAVEADQRVALTPEPLMQMIQGIETTAILQAAVRLGVFDQIAGGRDDAGAIAAGVEADERGTRILLDALAALGLLEKDGGYRLTPLADAFLVSSRPSYLGSMTEIMAGEWAWEAYPRLDEAVRRGGTILDRHAEVPGHEMWETFARASVGVAAPASGALAEALKPWAQQRETLETLDIACGSGLFGLTLAAQYPQARLTLLDWPNVLALTRVNVEQMGLSERTSFIEGDVFEAPLGGPYDLILASHIFHHFSEQRCAELMRRLAGALKPDGRLAINEFTASSSKPSKDPFPSLFSVIMLAWTREGEAYPLETYERMLADAGFASPEVHDSIGMPSRFLIAARSPQ